MTEEAQQEYVLITDPVTQVATQVPKSLEPFIGHIIQFNKKAGKEPIANENAELKGQIESLQIQLNEVLEKKTKEKSKPSEEVEKLKAEMQQVIAELNKKNELASAQADEWKTKHFNQQKINDIQSALGSYNLHNRNQLVNILSSQAKLKEDIDLGTGEKKGTYKTYLALNLPDEHGQVMPTEMEARTAVEAFLNMEENQFHLKNKLSPGSGSADRDGRTTSQTMKREQFDQLLPAQRIETVKAGVKITD